MVLSKRALEVELAALEIAPGRIPVPDLTRLTTGINTAIRRIGFELAQARNLEGPNLQRDLKRALELAVTGVRPGSVVIDLDFGLEEVAGALEDLRLHSIRYFMLGIADFHDHKHLPVGWPQPVLKSVRYLRPLLRRYRSLVFRIPSDPELSDAILDRATLLNVEAVREILDRSRVGFEEEYEGYGPKFAPERRREAAFLPPERRRKKPRLGDFASRQSLTDELREWRRGPRSQA